MPAATACCGRSDRRPAAVDEDLAGLRRVGAEHRARHLGAPGAHQAGEAQDLARRSVKLTSRTSGPQLRLAHLERDFAAAARAPATALVAERAADHHADDRLDAGRRGRHGADIFAVAQDRDAVGDLLQLVHLVRDVDDADAARLQFADDLEQFGDLGVVQRRGRLVHDQHARVERQRLGDLDHLLLGDGQAADDRARIDARGSCWPSARGGLAVELVLVEKQAESRFAARGR